MDSNIKKEPTDQLIQLKIEDDDSSTMPSTITSALLEIPAAASVDVHAAGIEISSVDEPIIDFEHGPNKQYSIALGQYRNRVTIHDLRQMGLDDEGEDMETAAFDLALTFKNGGQMVGFCIKLKEVGYTARR